MIVKHIHRNNKLEHGMHVVCTIEEHIKDAKKIKLTDLVAICLEFSQATMDRVQQEEHDIVKLRKHVKKHGRLHSIGENCKKN